MQLNKRRYQINGNQDVSILTPQYTEYKYTAVNDSKGNEYILSNSLGYQYLRECLLIASELNKDEILYLPIEYRNGEFDTFCKNLNYYKGIFLRNYCSSQLTIKDIIRVHQLNFIYEQEVKIEPKNEVSFIEPWKTKNRLTIKVSKELLFISTNKDGFISLAYGADHFSDWGDNEKNNIYAGHHHYDWYENTSKSVGITFYYWQM